MPEPGINRFISQFRGGARPNMFDVIVTFPAGVGGVLATNKLSFSCKASSIPASNVSAAIVPYFGREIKVAGDRTFDPWNITVINDTDFTVRNAFEEWLQRVNAHEANVAAAGYNNPLAYLATAQVTQYDREHVPIAGYIMHSIYPSAVGQITLGWDANNQVEEFEVTFEVNYWEPTNVF